MVIAPVNIPAAIPVKIVLFRFFFQIFIDKSYLIFQIFVFGQLRVDNIIFALIDLSVCFDNIFCIVVILSLL